MTAHRNEALQRLTKLINVLMMALPFILCWYIYYDSKIVKPFYRRGHWIVIGLFLVLYSSFGKLYDAFLVSLVRISEMVYSQAIAALMTDGIMYFVIMLLTRRPPNPVPIIIVFFTQIGISAIWSRIAHKWYFASYPPKKTAIIYDVRKGLEDLVSEYGLEKKFDIQKILHVEECLENIEIIDDVETVFLSGVHSSDRNGILKYCVFRGITVYVMPRIGDLIMAGAKRMHLFHLPILRVDRYSPSFIYLGVKRGMDIVLCILGIIITAPVMLATALAIKLYDGGPVFYAQERLTKDGKKFRIHKFRSMKTDAEKDGVARLSTGDSDDRITPVGRFIRKVRIDELPQMFDILAGNLTIVGPRPERPEIAAQYEKEMPEFGLRLQAKRGLTGYRQVYGKYNTTPYDKLQMDLMYISNPSIIQDLQIILATIKILFMPESTEGVASRQLTAMIEEREKSHKKENVKG